MGDQSVELTSDASGNRGCGVWYGLKWFQMQRNDRTNDFSIAIKKLVPIIFTAVIWGKILDWPQGYCQMQQ